MDALQVMPLDSNFQRLSGPLDYESLIWSRKYYETGSFEMHVLSTDYDPKWCYIYTPFRPEMGVIEKVEYDDTSHTPDGKDTIIVSGFFLERFLDNAVFLVEESEQEQVFVPKPNRPPSSAPEPNLVQDQDGTLYLEYDFPESAGGVRYNRVDDGANLWPPQLEDKTFTQLDMSPGVGMNEETYPIRDVEGNQIGTQHTGWYQSNFNYYSQDGKLHTVDGKGEDTGSYDIVGNGTNVVVYKDGDSYKWVWGVATSFDDAPDNKYHREVQQWESRTGAMEHDENGVPYYWKTVEGPWQLRTDLNDVTTPQDNVQWILKMVQKTFGSNYIYATPEFEGETKVLSPSLTTMADFFHSELKTIGASYRVFYDFRADQMIFQIYRGLDRTQDSNSPSIDDPEATAPMSARASDYPVPDGYTALEYIEGTGTQYIDTGFKPDQNTRAVIDVYSDSTLTECTVFGSRITSSNGAFDIIVPAGGGWRDDYGTHQQGLSSSAPVSGRFIIDKNKANTKVGNFSYAHPSQTFTTGYSCYLLNLNTSGNTTGNTAKLRVYSCQMYDNGTLARDFVPSRRDSDGAIGLYDTIDGVFYPNAGTGVFLQGPEIERPTEPEPEPEPSPTPDGNAWMVFSDTWGTLYDYKAMRDTSNYRNTCYVLYDFEEPEWGEDGHPVVNEVIGDTMLEVIGYQIPYNKQRSWLKVRLDDSMPDRESWLDKRQDKPEGDGDWPRDMQDEKPDVSMVNKSDYDAFKKSLYTEGRALLESTYPIEENLDTGTLVTDAYMAEDGFDLGDLVDMLVTHIGMKTVARITEVEEVHESGRHEVHLTIGEPSTTKVKKGSVE